jgi:gliding motility-associated-like protein
MPGQSVLFTPNQQYSYYQYYWNFDDPTSNNNTVAQVTPTHTFASNGTYCPQLIIISSQTGCVDSFRVCLDVLNGVTVTIPNVFSPNGDLINDVFSVKMDGVKEFTCDIYDRWGLRIYGWNGGTGSWDGTYQGKPCSDGTYFYVITTLDIKGGAKDYKGYVQLIR